jgi:beta-xylosidase
MQHSHLARTIVAIVVGAYGIGVFGLGAPEADAVTNPTASPTYAGDFPDPSVLVTQEGAFAYATNSATANVPVLRSSDLVHWHAAGDAMPRLPSWAAAGKLLTWAPAVTEIDGEYVMYTTLFSTRRNAHCIAVATSNNPDGPFHAADTPLACGTGAIDASPFVAADGSRWLTWKYEAGAGAPSRIETQPLSADGRDLVGTARVVLTPTLSWEHGIVEGPSMYVDGDAYWLFFSAGDWQTDDYATGIARCAGPAGPCAAASQPMLATGVGFAGPGGLQVFTAGDRPYVAFHTWTGGLGYPDGNRALVVRGLTFTNTGPALTDVGIIELGTQPNARDYWRSVRATLRQRVPVARSRSGR